MKPASSHQRISTRLPKQRLWLCLILLLQGILSLGLVRAQDQTTLVAGEDDEARVLKLAEGLTDECFSKRQEASRQLAAASPAALPLVLRLSRKSADYEQAQRLLMAARKIFTTRVATGLPGWNRERGYLGIDWSPDEDAAGVRVSRVFEGSAAESAGLRDGDLILAVNGNRFKEGQVQQQASAYWRQMLEGDQVNLLVKKEDEVKPRNLVATPLRREEGGFRTPSIPKEEVLWIRYQKEAITGR